MREVRRSHVEPRVSRGYLLKPYYCLYSHPTRLLPSLIFNRAITRYSQPLLDRVPDMR